MSNGVRISPGRVAVVQSDSRFCRVEDTLVDLPYWWRSVRMNAQWAYRQGYTHLTYCVPHCTTSRSSTIQVSVLSAAWCKLPTLMTVLRTHRYDTVLYLDSDAFWNITGKSLRSLGHFMWPGDWSDTSSTENSAGSIFFGCNLPWAGEDRGRRQWNRSWINGARGPPNTGVMLLRCDDRAMTTLSDWWHAPLYIPRWNQKHQWEQSALWQLWHTRAGFAEPLRVLSDPASGDCMRTMDRSVTAPIVHVPGGGRLALKQRNEVFRAADADEQAQNAPWTTWLIRLDLNASVTDETQCGQRLTARTYLNGMQLSPLRTC
mmetsp:Transcript_62882/g.124202  ORF Transcript_62882/g.124202 Transcript_62882/m.124202 type:complete len:317 (-) Transcript_62882:599-1549(-)|eukprot:CAMPEP_0174702690 /NCGR_PEP_ID=MMETSP1094-20130205/6893_1 /TAXON_ID=156173 /ORGANISM="Chrysochromulina brevifilum, Strain UTEX LB 985" /LENGTH=316 /DNA_ID=CAMNT_0015900503 /DNA_START=36 /DNA_END=986 /DNA_ORIENTATION=+